MKIFENSELLLACTVLSFIIAVETFYVCKCKLEQIYLQYIMVWKWAHAYGLIWYLQCAGKLANGNETIKTIICNVFTVYMIGWFI